MALYESDVTQFLRSLKEQRPALENEQRQGRALLWDKAPLNLDERRRFEEARVRQKAYVYSND